MIRLFIFIVSLLAWSNGPDGIPSTVQEIRQAYKVAQLDIQNSHCEGVPRNELIETIQYMVPGTGPTTETFCCYYRLHTDETDWSPHYQPFFITRKYNVSARKFYEEYLFDASSGRLLFVFIQSDNFDGGKNEERYYYGPDGLISEIVNDKRTVTEKNLPVFATILRDSVSTRLNASLLR